MKTRKEELRELKAEKAKNLRYKKSALQEMSYYAIRQGLEEITEACYDVDWLFDSSNEDAIYEVLEETYEDFDEFRNAFTVKGSEIMYAVIDCYEGEAEIVGRAETVEQAKQIERNWIEETDGECWTEIVKYNNKKPLSGGNR